MVIHFSIWGKAQVSSRQVFNQSAYCIASSQRKTWARLKSVPLLSWPHSVAKQFTDALSRSQINCSSQFRPKEKLELLLSKDRALPEFSRHCWCRSSFPCRFGGWPSLLQCRQRRRHGDICKWWRAGSHLVGPSHVPGHGAVAQTCAPDPGAEAQCQGWKCASAGCPHLSVL